VLLAIATGGIRQQGLGDPRRRSRHGIMVDAVPGDEL
jgi:hypothetical protein